jgi:putative nucleotidyltransferase with HDIG domain
MAPRRKSKGGFRSIRERTIVRRLRFLLLHNIGAQRILVAIGVALALLIFSSPERVMNPINVQEGEVADSDVIAPYKFPVYKDQDTLEKEKARIEHEVTPVFYIDKYTTEIVLSQVDDFFGVLESMDKTGGGNPVEQCRRLGLKLSSSAASALFKSSSRKDLELATVSIVKRVMDEGVIEDISELQKRGVAEITLMNDAGEETAVQLETLVDPHNIDDFLKKYAEERYPHDAHMAEALAGICRLMIRPNLVENKTLTQERIAQKQSELSPISYWVLKDEKIVEAHRRITAEQEKAVIAMYDYASPGRIILLWMGRAFLMFTIITILGIYVYKNFPEIYQSLRSLLVMALVVVLTAGMGRLLIFLFIDQLPEAGLLFPAAAGSILITLLFSSELGIVIALFLGFAGGIITGLDINVALVSLVGASVGAISLSVARQRMDLFWAAAAIAIANLIVIMGIKLVDLASFSSILYACAWGLAGAIGSVLLATMVLPLIEHFSGLVSNIKLLELSNLNQPLLRKLAAEAVGTYHHSILVGNLAAQAAEVIGANSLLCRVGGYYHDIGKMNHPEYFVENQTSELKPHETITPHLSTLIIANHIKEGVAVAQSYKLPEVIIDLIRQHHGTSLISFFYQKALQSDRHKVLDESDYRYAGPTPTTKESAILMVADAAESASRSLAHPTPANLRNLIDTIVDTRIKDGQFSDSNITLKELRLVEESLAKELSAIYHARIDYPKQEAPLLEEKVPMPVQPLIPPKE